MVLGHHAGAAQHHLAGGQQVFQIAQTLAEQKFVHIADEGVVRQVRALIDGRVARQVAGRAIQAQRVIAQLAAHIGAALRTFDGDGQVGLALGQADKARNRQDIQRDVRIASLEVGRERRQHIAAEAFGGADAQMARQGLTDARQVFAGGMHHAFHLFGMHEQALAVVRQHEAGAARLLEQQGVQLGLERPDAARHGGVLHAKLARRRADALGAGHFQEIAQAVPIKHDPALPPSAGWCAAGKF
ncbi:hypothetical protein D3C86_1520790 [compost metagenome]